MAWTDKYVDLADGGSGDGSSGDPWASFAEAVSELGAVGAPTRIFVRGNGSLGATLAFSNDGTTEFPVRWIGCTGTGATWTEIGDVAAASKPTLTCSTYQVTVTGDYNQFENLAFTGAVTTSGGLVSNTSAGLWGTFIRCRFTNTAASTAARALSLLATSGMAYACYFECPTSGTTATTTVYTSGSSHAIIGCHVKGGESSLGLASGGTCAFNICEACDSNSAILLDSSGVCLLGNTIVGAGADGVRQSTSVGAVVLNNLIHSATGIAINNSAANNFGLRCFNNLFYSCGTNAVAGTPEGMAWSNATAATDPLPNLTEPANSVDDFSLATAYHRLAFPGLFEAGAYEFVGRMSHGAIQPLPDFPSAGNVHSDDTVDGAAGTLTVPAEAQVEDGVSYGAGGTEFTGTLVAATPDYPGEVDVRFGVDYNSATMTGTLVVPNVADVRDGTVYDGGVSEKTGEMLVYSTWTETEKSHIRYRLGIDGTEAAPTNTPTLGTLTANVTQWNGTNVSTPNVAGVPKVDVAYVLGEEVNNDGSVDANVVTVATDAIDADALAADAGTEIGAAVKTAIEAAGSHLTLILEDTGTTLPATLDTIDNFLDTEVAAILQDTDELQKAITDGGRTDLLIDAIKAKTDLMLDQAAIRTAVGLASANLDTQIAGLSGYVDCLPATWVTVPTAAQNATAVRSELATELGRVDASVSSRAAAATALSNVTWTDTKAGYLDAPISEAGGGAGDGTGADEVTITWTSNGLPVGGGDVWITTDPSGDNVVAGTLQTNDNGQATFMLDDGSVYFLWGQRSGVNSIRGERFVAVAD